MCAASDYQREALTSVSQQQVETLPFQEMSCNALHNGKLANVKQGLEIVQIQTAPPYGKQIKQLCCAQCGQRIFYLRALLTVPQVQRFKG